MVRFNLDCPDEDWYEWADGVPRSKNLNQRIVELIRLDKEGEV